ncbi:MAG TPA: cytochrome c-type biogenesis protein [Xanthomonadaceae bacterium]|jgi:cytochrome c-type biogenesis protein CcmH|nr:cytochrome c-type biogenesis protein [Xanthomonadaceae bacterium]
MSRFVLALVLALSFGWAAACMAQTSAPDAPIVYRDTQEEARFHALASSLRCVMCQNESLADSQAMIAHDLRRQILAMMRDGRSDAQIRDFLVARYGEFVLYQPRVEPATWPLWFGPLALFVCGGATVAWIVRKRSLRLRAQARPAPAAAEPTVESSEDW